MVYQKVTNNVEKRGIGSVEMSIHIRESGKPSLTRRPGNEGQSQAEVCKEDCC